MAPVFTLRFGEATVIDFRDQKIVKRWLLESDAPSWTPLNSGRGNVNTIAHSDWAHRWATEQLAAHSPYTVTAWVHDEATDTWTAELKRIRHNFRIVWANGETETLHAKNAADAEEVQDDIRRGSGFIELVNAADDADFVNLAHVFGITYQPTEVDL